MRIIGGKYRSLKIDFPLSSEIRPTKDRIREAIFSALGNEVTSKIVLDLFAGSGSYGLETLSRGASEVTFVDKNQLSIDIIKNNLIKLKINKEHFNIFKKDYLSFISDNKKEFSLVFLDPPYKMDVYIEIIKILEQRQTLTKNSIIVCEADHEIDFSELDYKIKEYHYGEIFVYILRR
jgi:16S rRNA (guanine(966)-N(2))-methyltransferase RsmD